MVHVKDLNLNLVCGGKNTYGDVQSYIHYINQVPPSPKPICCKIIKCKCKEVSNFLVTQIRKIKYKSNWVHVPFFPFSLFNLSTISKVQKTNCSFLYYGKIDLIYRGMTKTCLWLCMLFPAMKLDIHVPLIENISRAMSTFSPPWFALTLKNKQFVHLLFVVL